VRYRVPYAGVVVHLRQSLVRPTDALPLDILRILIGVVAFAYFLQTLLNANDFSSPDGLIDHELSQSIFGYTDGLFHPFLRLKFFKPFPSSLFMHLAGDPELSHRGVCSHLATSFYTFCAFVA